METVELVGYLRGCERGLRKKGWDCTAAIVRVAAGRLYFFEAENERLIGELAAARAELDALKEKQKPKKAKITLKGTTDYNTKVTCPTCKLSLLHSRANYCYICGQAIEWGEVKK